MTQTRSAARWPIVAAILSGAGLMSGIAMFSSAPASAAATAPAAAPAASAAHRCTASDLHVSVTRGSAGAGSIFYTIRFTNVSSSACTLDGYPGVSVAKHSGGKRVGKAASRDHSVRPRLVTIARGATAHAILHATNPDNISPACHPADGRWVKVYPPGQVHPQFVHRTIPVCTNGTRTMSVRPVRPGRGEQN
jgi:hypothetical protein